MEDVHGKCLALDEEEIEQEESGTEGEQSEQDESSNEHAPMEEAYDIFNAAVREEIGEDIFNAAMKGEIGEDFAAKDTLLRFKTLEVGNNIVHIAVRHQTLQDVHSSLPDLLRQKNNHGSTPLHEAAAFGNKETIQLLIFLLRSTSSNSSSSTPGAYLLEVNKDGETPFHVALRSRNMAAAQELFSDMKEHHCVMTEILDKKTHSRNETPLHFYVRYCADEHFPSKINRKNGKVVPNQALIQQLIQANVKGIFKADDFEDLNPLMRAAQHGRVLVIYWMLLLYPLSMLEWRDSKGRGFLHHLRLNITENATDRGYTLSICKCILEFPGVADILTCSRDQDGKTPLHLAILDRDFDLAQLILQRYVDEQVESTKKSTVSMKNIEGKAVYDMIKSGLDIPRILKCLMEQASWRGVMCKWDELYKAAINLDVDAIEAKYITSEVDESGDYPNSQDEQGRNILHIALQHHHQSCYYEPDAIKAKYRAFIEKAIERFPKLIFQKDQNGDTPLHIAARLLSLFATILLQISFKKLSGVHDESINLLPRPWKVKDSRGQTPLHEAVRTENSHMLKTMLRNMQKRYRKEAVSEVNEYGETVFHVLARCDSESHIVRVLEAFELMQIALWMRDVDGLTLVLRAAHCGQPIMVKKMFTQSCRLSSIIKSDYKGRNVLHHLFASTLTKTDELMDLIQHLETNYSVEGEELILSQDDDGNTPLHLAITAGQNFELAEHLIKHCAKVKPSNFMEALTKTRNKEGKSIQHLVTGESGIPASLKAQLYDFKPPHWRQRMDDGLYKAIKENDIGRLPRFHHELHSISHDGSNILHVALRYRRLSIATWVLENSMNWVLLDEHDIKGDAPLHVAARLPPDDAFSFFNDYLNRWDSCYKDTFSREPWKAKNSKGDTYLHEAARFCNYEVIFSEELLNGKDIQDVNCRGETFLHVIAKYATNAAKDFLKNMSEQMQSLIYIRDSEGFTPVLRALQYGRLGVAMLLIQQCPHAVEIPDNKGGTILHHLKALVVDPVDLVIEIFPVWDKIFELKGIDDLRNAQNEDGNTALHLAIIDGDSSKAKYLMEKCLQSENKEELNIVNGDGHSVFDLVVLKADKPAMKKLQSLVSRSYIKERELMETEMDADLYRAAVEGNVQIFVSIADDSITDSRPSQRTNAYFWRQTPSGSNIVHIALRHGKENIENFIATALHYHPILSVRTDNNGDTPLHLAAAKSKSGVTIVQLLIRTSQAFLRDDIDGAYHVPPWAVKNYKGSFPIHEALQSDNLEAANALLNCDSMTASCVNDLGETPLHSFAKNGFSIEYEEADKFVNQLLGKSNRAAYVRDDEGLTPLLCAARSGRLEVVRAILQHRPQSAYIRDLCGRTFLHLLRYTGEDVDESLDGTLFKKTGKQLFEFPEADAQRLVQDYDGNTPLHYAIINGNSIAAIVLTYKCLEDKEQREFGLVNKKGQTIQDLLALHEVPNEIIEQIKKKVPTAVYLARSSYGIRKTEMKYSANALSVVAALLATITFAAGFQVPGGFNGDDGTPVLLRKPAFIVFITANTIAMCCSMLCLFLLLWVMGIGKIHGSLRVLDISIILIRLSFYLTLLAFTTGVFVTTAAKSLWLGILVIVLGALTFLLTFRFPFITVAQYGLSATKCIKKFIKKVKSKYKLASSTEGTNMTVNQTSEQDRTVDIDHE